MSRDAEKYLILHIMSLALLFGSSLNAGDGERGVFWFLSGLMVWPVIWTGKDFCSQVLADLRRQ